MSAAIEVLEIRKISGKGALRAFVKLRMGALVIHSCRVTQQEGQRPWVALPQQPAREKADGSGAGWYPIVEITNPDLLERVRRVVLHAWTERTHSDPEAWSEKRRDQRIQELARRFDERGPDSVPF
jgi:DNA-binding cell septation regulator SpoVG